MRFGTIIGMPSQYTQFARVRDENGIGYTVEPNNIPDDIEEDDEVAYKVELWGNDSGLVYEAEED